MPSTPSQKSIDVRRSAPTSVMWWTPWLWILRIVAAAKTTPTAMLASAAGRFVSMGSALVRSLPCDSAPAENACSVGAESLPGHEMTGGGSGSGGSRVTSNPAIYVAPPPWWVVMKWKGRLVDLLWSTYTLTVWPAYHSSIDRGF